MNDLVALHQARSLPDRQYQRQ